MLEKYLRPTRCPGFGWRTRCRHAVRDGVVADRNRPGDGSPEHGDAQSLQVIVNEFGLIQHRLREQLRLAFSPDPRSGQLSWCN